MPAMRELADGVTCMEVRVFDGTTVVDVPPPPPPHETRKIENKNKKKYRAMLTTSLQVRLSP